MRNIISSLVGICLILCACGKENEDQGASSETFVQSNEPKTAAYNEHRNVYFGDLHVHSSWSFDAFIYNVRTTPDDAYDFGKGAMIDHALGGKIQNERPLDFMSVTDHSEYMGIMMQMLDADNKLARLDIAKRIRSADRDTSLNAFGEIGRGIARNIPDPELIEKDIISDTWQRQVAIANKHYEPGVFTTFPGYEWTSSPSVSDNPDNLYAANLHRNVIYKGDVVSDIPFSSFDSQDPEELWKWMETQKAKGIELMAIPHNGNMSDGLMYPQKTFSGREMDTTYARLRADNEILNEVSQIKGTSMAHPMLHPNDEFADFEIYAFTFATGVPPASRPEGSYVRKAFEKGLAYEKTLGINPYKFGIIGSSDGHNSAGPVEEDNYFGKFGNIDGSPAHRLNLEGEDRVVRFKYMSAAGLAGVWARENTRTAIYNAMKRKEVFATSGPRIALRFFAAPDFSSIDLSTNNWVEEAYKNGVAMGGDLNDPKVAPTFIVWAVKDAEGANLDRIQIIKQWINDSGQTFEKIFNIVWSDNRHLNDKGQLPTAASTVNLDDATYENTVGAVALYDTWTDPEFTIDQSALYFMRVLEIPTPRWTTYDAREIGEDLPEEVPATIQERAWSSPIWVHPVKRDNE